MNKEEMTASERWNSKYAGSDFFYGRESNDFLKVASGSIKPGARILSLGEGEGRNAVFLARRGHRVTCVDASSVARDKALSFAREAGVEIGYEVMDLEAIDFQKVWRDGSFDAVVAIWCHLPSRRRSELHAQISKWLARDGVFILEAYTPEQLKNGTGGPKEIDLLYRPDDVRKELCELTLELFQTVERDIHEGPGHNGKSATLQVIGRNVNSY